MKVDPSFRGAQKQRREERREKRWARVMAAHRTMCQVEAAFGRRRNMGRYLLLLQAVEATHAALVRNGNPEHQTVLSETAQELQQEHEKLVRHLGWNQAKLSWALRLLARDKRLRRRVLDLPAGAQVKE